MDPLFDPTPLYFRIQRDLRNDIASGRLPPGAPLPTEHELREAYGVSRITVTKALDGLRSGGLIISRRGVGSFVAAREAPAKSLRLIGSLDEALAPVPDLQRCILGAGEAEAPSEVSEALEVDPGSRVWRVESLYATEAGPYSYAHAFMPPPFAESVDEVALKGGRPIVRILQDAMKLRVVRADQAVDPVNAGEPVAVHLGVALGTALLRVSRTYIAEGERRLLVVHSWFHPTRYRYAVQLLPAAS
jgi:GntR family transcriptional regulator